MNQAKVTSDNTFDAILDITKISDEKKNRKLNDFDSSSSTRRDFNSLMK